MICREVSDCSKPRLVSQIHNLTHQIQLFFLECQHQQCGLMDYSHFPGYAKNSPSEKTLALAEIKHEQEKLLYLCDSIKLSVRKDTCARRRGSRSAIGTRCSFQIMGASTSWS